MVFCFFAVIGVNKGPAAEHGRLTGALTAAAKDGKPALRPVAQLGGKAYNDAARVGNSKPENIIARGVV